MHPPAVMSEKRSPAIPLTTAEIRALRARAHDLKPVVMVGAAGVSDGVMQELDAALTHHELVKVRFLGAPKDDIRAATTRVCQCLGAQTVQRIGRVCVYYRVRPQEAAPAPRKATSGRRRQGAVGRARARHRQR
jgi:RNA-binding protein